MSKTATINTHEQSLFQNIKTIIASVTSIVVTAATTTEKTVQLVENEVDMLHAEQAVRLASIAKARPKPEAA